jgi:hypothetical protein
MTWDAPLTQATVLARNVMASSTQNFLAINTLVLQEQSPEHG